jgi:hypothetical protein
VSIRFLWRRGLLALAGAAAIAVAVPAVASADSLTLNPSSVPAASTSTNVEFKYSFTSGTKNLTTELPPGLLANANIGSPAGICLLTKASPGGSPPPASCAVTTVGTVDGSVPAQAFLVEAPSTGDIAGLDLAVNFGSGFVNAAIADITVRPASDPDGVGLNFAFKNMSTAVNAVDLTFTDLRMPTSCPSTPANVINTSDAGTFNTPISVTGCSSLGYTPTLSAVVKKDPNDSGAEVISTISQPKAATESSTKSTQLGFGTLSPNDVADLACITGTPCTVGTASATSPLVPSAALAGTVTLGPPTLTPTLTITFPVLGISMAGTINLSNNTVTFNNEPDFPLTSLTVDVTGPNGQKAFTTTCAPSNVTGSFTPWSGGAAVPASVPIQYQGCPTSVPPTVGKPTASGSLSGLPAGHPKLKVTVKRGSNAPNIKSVAIGPSHGLSFRKCVKKGKKHLCKGVSVSGGAVKSEKIRGGRLMIVLKRPVAKVTVTAVGPALTESKALQTKVKKHKVKKINFTIKVKDAKGKTTVVRLKLRA